MAEDVPPTNRAISGLLAARCRRLTDELDVIPRSATRPMRAGKGDGPMGFPVLKEYTALCAAFLSPTLHKEGTFKIFGGCCEAISSCTISCHCSGVNKIKIERQKRIK